jgi:hypothetical protein
VVIPTSWLQSKKIAELENKKSNSRARNSFEKGLIDFTTLVKSIRKHPDWVLEIYGKDTTSL